MAKRNYDLSCACVTYMMLLLAFDMLFEGAQ
jgi:hypothetical protein